MENLNKQIQELQKIIDTYGNIVFFGGAGVSTESGIPDFRSVDGLYHQQYDLPAGDDFKSHLLSFPHGGILPFLPE